MKENAYLNKSRDFLSNGRIQDCIDLLKENINDEDILNQILQLEVRYNSLKRRINSGTIKINDAQLEENRISNSLLLLISNLAKGNKGFIPNISSNGGFDFKWLIIGILGLSLFGLGIYVWSNNADVTSSNVSNPCENVDCLNGGTCRDGTCDCLSGYTGDRCQTKVQPQDPCRNINCLNGGVCRDGTCNCPTGYTGDRCQTRINPNELVDARDNTIYRIEKIGSKLWTLDNIKYNVPGSKCRNCSSKGRHYNLNMAKQACPTGWTLPSVNDFNELNRIGRNFQGITRLADIEFNGRYGRASGGNDFVSIGTFAAFWTNSSQGGNGSHFFYNKANNLNVFRSDVQGNDQMYSCRCVKRE